MRPMLLGMLAFIAALHVAPATAAPAPPATPQLVDQTGRTFTLRSLEGRPLIVTFVSAHCSDACPLVNAEFSQAASEIAHQALSTRLLTITLDPQHDPPSVMRALAQRFSANSRYWLVASGHSPDVNDVLNAFGVIAKPGKSGYREAHTTFVYVFDARGTLTKTLLASNNLTSDILAEAHAMTPHRVGR
ncbi:MAG: SCO family protein [Candidatus Tumulicola sp.]